MPQLRNIHFKFLGNPVRLSGESFSHKAIQGKLKEIGADENLNFLSGNENKLIISDINNVKVFKHMFQSFQEFISLKPPRQL